MCGALSLAELAAALPETGGFYAYLREGWGRRDGAFCFGWSELVLIRASALGGIAVVFGEYLLRSLGVDPVEHYVAARALSAGAIAFAACANIVGANVGAAIVGVSTLAKFSALVVLVGASFVLGGGHGAQLSPPDRAGGRADRRRRDGPRARQRAVGLRRLGRPVVCRRRGEGSAAEPAARDHPRHAGAHRASTC